MRRLFDLSTPLSSFEVLHTKLPDFETALSNRGITTWGHLVNSTVAKGVSRASTANQLADALNGKVFDGRSGDFTLTAKRLSEIARLPPDVAFAPLGKGEARAQLREEIGPARARRGQEMRHD